MSGEQEIIRELLAALRPILSVAELIQATVALPGQRKEEFDRAIAVAHVAIVKAEGASAYSEWAILELFLELFGHKRLAGLVSEVTLAGGSFLRVDVPDENGATEYTRYYNPSAIYSMSPVDQPLAVAFAQKVKEPPLTRYDLTRFTKALPVGALDFDSEEERD